MYEPLIKTERLELHHIPADGLISLFEEKKDLLALAKRSITNPHQVLVAHPGPLRWRVPQVKADPSTNKWFIRFIVLRASSEILGSVSFHGIPDDAGVVEIGIRIEEQFWNNGYASELLKEILGYGIEERKLREIYGIFEEENIASRKLLEKLKFEHFEKKTILNTKVNIHKYCAQQWL